MAGTRSTFARPFVLVALALLAAAVFGGGASGAGGGLTNPKVLKPTKTPYDPTTILVKFKTPSESATKVQSEGDRALGLIPGARVEVVKLQRGETVPKKLAEYRARADVAFAEPNYIVKPDALTPNDAMFNDQWGLANISAPAGWEVYPDTFSSLGGAKIAIIDTGVYAGHPDLNGKVLVNDGAGCLGSGFVCSNAYSSSDDFGHGTHVAGIAGAVTDNATGVAGVAVSSPLIPIKVCFAASTGQGCPIASIASGIAWAVSHGAKVINMSLGGPSAGTMCSATSAAIAKGVIVVAAAGNSGDYHPSYPASCSGVIGVAANGPDNDSAGYSNWDYPNVLISAPGGNDPNFLGNSFDEILSTVPFNLDDGSPTLYQSIQGTSMASPFVAGLAALLKSERPTRTPNDIRRVLAKTADKVLSPWYGDYGVPYGGYSLRGPDPFHLCAPGECTWHPFWGYGQINAYRALVGAPPKVLSFTPATGTAGTVVTINGEDLAAATEVSFGVPATASVGDGRTGTILSAPSENQIKVAAPDGAKTGQITVKTPGGTSTSVASFKVGPKVTGFDVPKAKRGDTVTVSGSGFTGATSVKLGLVAATTYAVVDDDTLTFVVPPTGLTGKVSVTTPSGTGTSAANLIVELPPTVTSFLPGSGPVGTLVTVSGSSLDSVDSASVGGVPVAAITHVSAASLKFTVPEGVPGNAGHIVVHNDVGDSLPSAATFKVSPKVTGFAPLQQVRGQNVVISGESFAGTTSVKIGLVTAPIVAGPSVVGDESITIQVPPTATTGKISVTTPNGTGTSAMNLVVELPPAVTTLTPASGPVGTLVTVSGSSLDSVDSATLGGLDVGTITHVSPTSLKFAVPDGVPGNAGKVVVHNEAGNSAPSAGTFKVTPKVTGFDVPKAQRGDTVTVSGSAFTGATAVKLGVVAATTFSVLDDHTLTFVVPPTGVTGKVSVTTPNGTGASAANLIVELGPTVTSFLPASGPVGTVVTVSGSSLDSVDSATLGGADVGTITHVSATSLKFSVPEGVPGNAGKVVVHNDAGNSAPSAGTFKVSPKVTGFAPLQQVRGQNVVVSGESFAGATSVKIGLVSAPIVAGPSVVGDETVTIQVPPTATTGKISVTTPNGTGTSATSLQVLLTPTISSFTPTSGPAGTTVTVSGTNLDSVTSATINGADAGAITHVSPTSLRINVPIGAAASGHISVTNPAGTATSAGFFTVPLLVTGFSPTQAVPGTQIMVQGAGLSSVTLVEFNGSPAVPVLALPTVVYAYVPPQATSGPIKVITATGQSATSTQSFVVPTVSGFGPTSGPPSTSVIIAGDGFTGATSVKFNGVNASSYTVDSQHQITADVPPGATDGPITVAIPGIGNVASAASFAVTAAPAGTATFTINEVAPNITGDKDLVELNTVTGGSMNGVTLKANGTTIATLPNVTVLSGQFVVVHLNDTGTTETTGRSVCTAAACYHGAWDVFTGTGIAQGAVVLTIESGGVQDAVAFADPASGASPQAFLDELAAVQGVGQWDPADCGGAACDDGSSPAAQGISASWSGVGAAPTDPTVQRIADGDTQAASDWQLAAESLGSANP